MSALRRIIAARTRGAHKVLIAHVQIKHDTIVVWSCEPRRYAVKVSKIPSLANMKMQDLMAFQLSHSGSRIHWDAGDIDLGLESIQYFADPK